MPASPANKTLLLIGASRGLGCAMAAEYLERGWHVVATVRGASKTTLHDLVEHSNGELEIETVDINAPDQVAALHARLAARKFYLLFVNAGVANMDDQDIGEVSTGEFVRVIVTNSLSPMRVIESMKDLVVLAGTIGVMSSGQGSVATTRMENMRCTGRARRHSTC